MSVKVYVNDKRAKKLLSDIVGRAKNKGLALRIIASKMHKDVLKHFDDEKGEKGKWKPLAESTKAWKKKHGYSKMLQNTGQLRRHNLPYTRGNKAIVENSLDYAKKQNMGKGKIPARDFLWLSKIALKDIVKYMTNYLVRGK